MTEQYNIITNFNNKEPHLDELYKECEKVLNIINIVRNGNDIDFVFSTNLLPSEKTLLDSIVNNYVHIDYDNTGCVVISDIKPAGTDGGDFNKNNWEVRELNTINPENIKWCTLSNSQITLEKGEYLIDISAPAYKVKNHQARLYNVTDSSVVEVGTSEYTDTTFTGKSVLSTKIKIDNQNIFEIQHKCSKSISTVGFGIACGMSQEKYTTIKIQQL